VADAAGNTSPASPAIKSVSGLTHIAWLSNRGIFGAGTPWRRLHNVIVSPKGKSAGITNCGPFNVSRRGL
jgi:hypothetical protein